MEQVCLNGLPEVVGGVITAIVTVASIAANLVKSESMLGKIVHFLAINLTATKK
jgi:hypothetical protein